jgi:ethanolamine utilization protein EutA (predicted chaperonin)
MAAAAAAQTDAQSDLPKNVVKRIVKEKLAQTGKADLQINKEALLAFGESAKVRSWVCRPAQASLFHSHTNNRSMACC